MREIVFMGGVPGAGKTTLVQERGLDKTHRGITHHLRAADDYEEEININGSYLELLDKFAAPWKSFQDDDKWIFDGSSIQTEAMVELFRKSRVYNYRVKLIYIHVDPEVAVERNARRDEATRVPEEIIRDMAERSDTSLALMRNFADEVEVVDNRNKEGRDDS